MSLSLDPKWVLVWISVAGIVFQAGIGWAILLAVKRQVENADERADQHAAKLVAHEGRLDEHERRFIDHYERIRSLERHP